MAEQNAPIRVGLLGAGTVGSQTARILVEQKDELGQRIGRPLEISGIACLDPNEVDFPWIDKSLLTSDTMSVVKNADIVVELIGGTGVARTFVLEALNNGASVVTANKALLAKYGPELYKAAEDNPCGYLLRGGGRRRDPDRAPAARVARRRSGEEHARHCQRHDELHSRRDDHQGPAVR